MQQKPPVPPPPYTPPTHTEAPVSRVDTETILPPASDRVSGPRLQGPDVAYLKTVPGIAKIVQAVSEISHSVVGDLWL